jgi:hypothetical protein
MEALDNFISPIPGFQGDIPIPVIPVSAQFPSGESTSDPSVRASAGASNTLAGKCKGSATLIPHKKAKRVMGKSTGGIKINEPTPKASSILTPPSGYRKKIPICRQTGIPDYDNLVLLSNF